MNSTVDLGAINSETSVVLELLLVLGNLETPHLDLRVTQTTVCDARIAKSVVTKQRYM